MATEKNIAICSVLFARWEVVESRADRQAPLAMWFYVRVRVWPVDTSGILYFVLLWKNYILKLETFYNFWHQLCHLTSSFFLN